MDMSGSHILHLHDFAETALSDNLEQLKVFNLQGLLTVLDKLDTNP